MSTISFGSASADVRPEWRASQAAPKPLSASRRWTCARLWLRVQADAFRFAPRGYLQAVAWRMRGLKLRSRNRFAALAGRSPAAYDYWIACREPAIRAGFAANTKAAESPIVVVVDCTGASQAIADTLQSIPDGTRTVILRGPQVPGTLAVGSVGEIANALPGQDSWLCPIACGDRLAAGALAHYWAALASSPEAPIAYGDDDLLDPSGRRSDPHFKPDWNPELFEHHDFLTGSSIFKVRGEDLRSVSKDGWSRQLVRRLVAGGAAPLHVPLVLHHRRDRPGPKVPAKPRQLAVSDWPLLSVIIPTRNRADLLRTCIAGLDRTSYPNFEVLVVDNGSDEPASVAYLDALGERGVRLLRLGGPFNYSRLNNRAVQDASGVLLCFLNNDVEMTDPDWLTLLAAHAREGDVGAAGARLLYPDGTIQHAGVFTGVGGGAGHGHRFQRPDQPGYFERARLPQRVSAVTGACMVVARDKFLAVGGFDEENFPVAFNDVDLCLKLNERGWHCIYEPRATLVHHESKSRGSDRSKPNRARFAGELAMLKRKWNTDTKRDPFHHPQLSEFCEQFLIAV